jgi:hypothetical protein
MPGAKHALYPRKTGQFTGDFVLMAPVSSKIRRAESFSMRAKINQGWRNFAEDCPSSSL